MQPNGNMLVSESDSGENKNTTKGKDGKEDMIENGDLVEDQHTSDSQPQQSSDLFANPDSMVPGLVENLVNNISNKSELRVSGSSIIVDIFESDKEEEDKMPYLVDTPYQSSHDNSCDLPNNTLLNRIIFTDLAQRTLISKGRKPIANSSSGLETWLKTSSAWHWR